MSVQRAVAERWQRAMGVPDEKSGEAVMVHVVKKDPAIDATQAMRFTTQQTLLLILAVNIAPGAGL